MQNDQNELQRIFALQRKNRQAIKQTTAAKRKEKLQRLKQVVLDHAEEVADALAQDLRKPREQPISLEIATVVMDIDHALQHLDDWMKPQDLGESKVIPGGRIGILYEPRGICLLFGPWNFPFQLVFEPLVPIIAAGNCAIVKPNEMATATSIVSAKIISEVFDPDEIAVFEGGVDIANAMLDLPVDHIFFTGSPNVGKIVMAAAARHLASVTLELGGKCPAIVDGTYDLASAAELIATWRCYNTGQLCLSTDHVWVREDLRDEFLALLTASLKSQFYENGRINKNVIGKIIDERNLKRVSGYVEDAVEHGASIAFGGEVEVADRTVHPTILIDVPLEAQVMQDEIFGPVLPVLTYKNPQDIVDATDRMGKPLALYIFSEDEEFIDWIIANTSSGGVTVNGVADHWWDPELPFGGVNKSGIGRYHGIHGFKELSHERSIFRKTPEA
jgi:aldehyde dehydrogenase (NAD+)